MVNKYIECGLIAALAALSTASIAAPTADWGVADGFQGNLSAPGLSATPFQDGAGLATRFDAGNGLSGGSSRAKTAASAFTLDSQTAQAIAASSDATTASGRMRALSETTGGAATAVGSTAALQLTLWNFINNVRAQQVGNQFQSLMTSAANIDYTINGVPAPTPLPASSWLFLGGVVALGAMRWRVRRGARDETRHQLPKMT